MTLQEQISTYISLQPEPKRHDLQTLHDEILRLMPGTRLWFLDGKDDTGKTVSNPNIGYGQLTMTYAGGKTREFYQIGLSANTAGISVYIMGLKDKEYLAKTYGNQIGKANVTGYCIKFRSLKVINIDVLKTAILRGIQEQENSKPNTDPRVLF